MPGREIYGVTLLFLFVHTVLFGFGFVQGVDAYMHLSSELNTLNPNLGATQNLDVNVTSQIDPVPTDAITGALRQLTTYATLVDFGLKVLPDLLSIFVYLFIGVSQTLTSLGVPSILALIIGVPISVIQIFGFFQFLLDVLASIPRF